jgi:hypothetical protein
VADGVMIATQASGVDLTFASQLPRPREANVKSKTPLDTSNLLVVPRFQHWQECLLASCMRMLESDHLRPRNATG